MVAPRRAGVKTTSRRWQMVPIEHRSTARPISTYDVVHLLVNRVGLAEFEVAAMTKDQAIARLNRYWSDGS